MNHVIGVVILLVFIFLALQFGMKIDVWGWIKKNIFKK
jgi:hypothetical protein